MDFIANCHTDVGISKESNQDAITLKVVETKYGKVVFSVVCDGMGGLAKGELASKEVLLAFCDWFDNTLLPTILKDEFDDVKLIEEWNEIIQIQNDRLKEYGEKNNIMLGTTVSGLLIVGDQYYFVHVGDSRIYEVSSNVVQLTSDQTFIAREIAAGRMTKLESLTDSRRSVLLQCVGASKVTTPDFAKGVVKPNTVYMLCSDGFRHKIDDEEIRMQLGPDILENETQIKQNCINLTELIKSRKETDNITVAVIKAI